MRPLPASCQAAKLRSNIAIWSFQVVVGKVASSALMAGSMSSSSHGSGSRNGRSDIDVVIAARRPMSR